jgi:hypothetical protein
MSNFMIVLSAILELLHEDRRTDLDKLIGSILQLERDKNAEDVTPCIAFRMRCRKNAREIDNQRFSQLFCLEIPIYFQQHEKYNFCVGVRCGTLFLSKQIALVC